MNRQVSNRKVATLTFRTENLSVFFRERFYRHKTVECVSEGLVNIIINSTCVLEASGLPKFSYLRRSMVVVQYEL